MSDIYSKKVMEHFMNPRNVGEIKDADGVGEVGNPTCGDLMKMYIKVKKQPRSAKAPRGKKDYEEIIEDIKFQTFGCGAAVATSSMVTEMVKGETLEEAEKITNRQVAEELGGLPPIKMHCSNLAADAIHDAIANYRNSKR